MDRLPFPEKRPENFAETQGSGSLSDLPIFQLLNTQSLLKRFNNKPQAQTPQKPSLPGTTAASRPNPAPSWPGIALLPSLKERLPSTKSNLDPTDVATGLPKLSVHASAAYEQFSRIFDHFTKDASYSRDQLLSLNPGRRKLIEHRLEFIARKVARARGERLTRGFSLTEVLRESYRDSTQGKLSSIAWRGFVSEVALYQMLELFFLKALDANGWRRFESSDLGRMNYCANLFLSQRALGFAHDKHCWNFVRTNLYSWYVPSSATVHEITKLLDSLSNAGVEWNERSLLEWFSTLGPGLKPPYFEFENERRLSKLLLDFVEKGLGSPLVGNFQGQRVCKKTFFPVLESGALAFSLLDRVLDRFSAEGIFENPSQLQRAVWACEVENFESYWTEVLTLLKLVSKLHPTCPISPDRLEFQAEQEELLSFDSMRKLPHHFHSVNVLGLELHNLDQLPLGSADDASSLKLLQPNSFQGNLFQGSAAEIQRTESFDLSFVLDHPDRTKSAKWMKAISDQLPYWGNLVGSSSNLNWGELHLSLALTKLRENGYCLYLSHRVLPEGGDGEKLRRSLLNVAALEAFLELGEELAPPYKYLYVFRRTSQKTERDRQRPRFGHLKTAEINLSLLEEANSTQAEIMERGWDHLFVRGAAPMVRHLNHKFPRLYQLATVQTVDASTQKGELGLFNGNATQRLPALEIQLQNEGKNPSVRFYQNGLFAHSAKALLFPHNTVDLPWLACLLNSPPAQFWIKNHLQQNNGHFKASELKHCPIVDLSHAPSDHVHEALDWLGKAKPDRKTLREWAMTSDSPIVEKYAKFVALSRRHSSLTRIVARYRGLFTSDRFEDLRPEAVTQFYPAALLVPATQLPEMRLQYVNRERTGLSPDHWIVEELHSVSSPNAGDGKPSAFTIVHTRQGPSIQILMPMALKDYVNAQLQQLKGHSWTEIMALLRVPSNVTLFTAQTTEIKRVICSTAAESQDFEGVLNEMALDLFEISPESRHLMLN